MGESTSDAQVLDLGIIEMALRHRRNVAALTAGLINLDNRTFEAPVSSTPGLQSRSEMMRTSGSMRRQFVGRERQPRMGRRLQTAGQVGNAQLDRVSIHRAGVAALAVMLVAVSGGCTRTLSPTSGGPLLTGTGLSGVCTPDPQHRAITVTEALLRNRSAGPLHLAGVELADASRVRLLAAYLVHIAGSSSFGNSTSFPPAPRDIPPGNEWARRQPIGPAATAVLPAEPGMPDDYELVLAVAPAGADTGSFKGAVITYSAGGHRYRRTALQAGVVSGSRSCSDNN